MKKHRLEQGGRLEEGVHRNKRGHTRSTKYIMQCLCIALRSDDDWTGSPACSLFFPPVTNISKLKRFYNCLPPRKTAPDEAILWTSEEKEDGHMEKQ